MPPAMLPAMLLPCCPGVPANFASKAKDTCFLLILPFSKLLLTITVQFCRAR